MGNISDSKKVLYVEPNYNEKAYQNIGERFYQHDLEDYSIYVDFMVEVYDRQIDGKYEKGNSVYIFSWKTTSGQTTASFLGGKKVKYKGQNNNSFNILTTDYTNTYYYDIVDDNDETMSNNAECFGIESIDISYNDYAVPQVTIRFVDIKGVSLFAPEELRHGSSNNGIGGFSDSDIAGSFFKCFFTFPYPRFTLKVKGFYGEPVAYELTCSDFKAKFDSKTGNYNADAKFVGYMFSLMNDISLNALLAAPLSDYLGKKYWESQVENGTFYITKPDEEDVHIQMPTFQTIIQNIGGLKKLSEENKSKNKDVYEKQSKAIELSNNLQSAQSQYLSLMNEFKESLRSIDSTMLFESNEDKGFVWLYSVVNSQQDFISESNSKIAKVNAQIQNLLSGATEFGNIPQISDLKTVKLLEETSNGEVKLPKTYGNQNPLNNLKNIEENINQELSSQNDKYKNHLQAIICDNSVFITNIDSLKSRSESVKNDTDKQISDLENIVIREVLGFTPSVRNIMKIIIAHLETLLYIIYTATDEVNVINNQPNPRTLKDFGITQKDLTGLKILTSEVVPPWPKMVKKNPKTDAYEDTWIGDFPKNGQESPEAQACKGLLNGINSINDTIKTTQEILTNQEKNSDKSSQTTITNTYVPLPVSIMDIIFHVNPFGSDELATSSQTITSIIERLFIRMNNLLNNDGGKVAKNFEKNPKSIEIIGACDAMNFYKLFGSLMSNNLKEQLLTLFNSSTNDELNKFFFSEQTCWVKNKKLPLCNVSGDSVINLTQNKFPIGGFNISDTINIVGNNYYYKDIDINNCILNSSGFNVPTYSASCFITNDVHMFDNIAFSPDYLKTDTDDWTQQYKQYVYDKYFNPQETKYDASKIYGDNEKYSFTANYNDGFVRDTDYFNSNLTFGKRWSYAENNPSHETLQIMPPEKSGVIPDHRRSIEEIRTYKSAFPSKTIDFSTISTINANQKIEYKRPSFQKASELAISNIDFINNDISSIYTVPTIQFYNLTGFSLFTLELFYSCPSKEEKAMLFLDNLRCHNLSAFWNDFYSNNKNFIYTTEVNVLLTGAYLYRYYKNKKMFTSPEIKNARSLGNINDLKKRLYSGQNLNESLFNDNTINQQTRDIFINRFIQWANDDTNGFGYYYNNLSINLRNNYTIVQFVNALMTKTEVEIQSMLKDDNFFKNYSKAVKGVLIHRENSEVIQKLTNFYVKPAVVVLPFRTSQTYTGFGGVRNYDSVFKTNMGSYLNGFKTNFAKLLTKDITQNDSHDVTAQLTKNPNGPVEIKIALYKYLKLIYDKWCGSTKFDDWTIEKFYIPHFHYIDTFYNDIGDDAMINPQKMCEFIIQSQSQQGLSLMSFISGVLAENNLSFHCIQNFIDLNSDTYANQMQRMFEPISYLEMSEASPISHFICLYKGEQSSHLNMENADYVDDSFMLDYGNETNWPEAIKTSHEGNSYPIPAFGVSYGSQYQSYFSDVSVGMDNAIVTEQALKAQLLIGNMNSSNVGENGEQVVCIGQDLFTVYANQSFTCDVTMLGCAWIQPLMYFVLVNIPMFRGSYLIEKVTHSISQGQMITKFTGVRMANTLTPFVKNVFNIRNDQHIGSFEENKLNGAMGSIDNDCGYRIFNVTSYDGGIDMSKLTEPDGYAKVTTDDNPQRFNGDGMTNSIADALASTAIAEAGNQGDLGIKLVINVFFNRWKNNGEDFKKLFTHGQIAFDKYPNNGKTAVTYKGVDFYNKVKSFVIDIFTNTPITLVGEATEVKDSVNIYVNNLMTEEFTKPMVITEDTVKKVYMYCTTKGYGKENIRPTLSKEQMEELKTSDPTLYKKLQTMETEPERWRSTEYLCHHLGHVFTSGPNKGSSKNHWEKTSKNDGGIGSNGICDLGNSLIDAVQKTIDATDLIDCKISAQQYQEYNKTFIVTSNKVEQMGTVFDIFLNGYSKYIKALYWVCDSANNAYTDKYPSKIYVVVNEGNNIELDIKVCKYENNRIYPLKRINANINTQFYKSLSKHYDVDTQLNEIKTDCKQFAGVSDETIINLLKNNKPADCNSALPTTETVTIPPSMEDCQDCDRY